MMKRPEQSRAAEILEGQERSLYARTDRLFAILMGFQFVAGLCAAWFISPRTWWGADSAIHLHVWAALVVGGLIASAPILLAVTLPGRPVTRYTIAVAQMLFSALLIHLTGGRIETHFHVFGSLAFLAFYRDWKVLVPATVVIVADHLARGIFWPESVFGVVAAAPWRAFEHAGWVAFEDVFLIYSCLLGHNEMRLAASREASLEAINGRIELEVEARTAELQLALNQRHSLEMAIDSTAILAITDERGRITHANDKFCEISGYDRSELLGQDHRILNSGNHSKEFFKEMYAAIGRGQLWRGEICNRAKDGKEYWVDTSIVPIMDDNGKVAQYIAVRIDITSRKKLYTQLMHAQKLESIGQLAAGIAHEINTPIQYVSDNARFLNDSFGNLLQLLEQYDNLLDANSAEQPWKDRADAIRAVIKELDTDFLKEEVPKAIEQTLEGADRVSKIVLAMKEFSHPGGSGEKSDADLNKAINSTITVCRNRWKYVAVLELDLQEDLPAVPCLVSEFNQVILNLVVNAADAIGERVGGTNSGELGRIWVTTRAVDEHVEVRVRDTGGGMPPEVQVRIFDPFFTTKQVGKGTGQGLAICHDVIVNKHGGSLDVESVVGEGSTFIVRVPRIDSATAADRKEAA